MNKDHISKIARELGLTCDQTTRTAALLEDGGSVPFIARYRKEVTGTLNEVVITAIRDSLHRLEEMDKRREAILKSVEAQGRLTDSLKSEIQRTESMSALEDIYLPYRPKRRTRAAMAREKGLESLAEAIFHQDEKLDPEALASEFIDTDKDISCIEAAMAGARDIIAEWINENQEIRAKVRRLFIKKGKIRTSAVHGKTEEENAKYKDYFNWEENAFTAPSHRVLAMMRGEAEGVLRLAVGPDENETIRIVEEISIRGGKNNKASGQVRLAVTDSCKRLLTPSMANELISLIKEKADEEAIRIFAINLRELLFAPPLGQKNILAIDPGFRTGCKLVCLNKQGKLLHNTAIYPHQSKDKATEAANLLKKLCGEFQIEAVAIGNGTAGRETERFVKGICLKVPVIMVNESGASIYSASEIAREEFPEYDITVRGAVSIGRRLADPLAELVKIDPKSIGVGQYQHDVDQSILKKSLDDVVEIAVNAVGVEVNTVSFKLLEYVSGIGPKIARNIVKYRNANGPFTTKKGLLKVPKLGPRAFEQAAGFLRINNGKNPLDRTGVHPESYNIVETMSADLKCSVTSLMDNPELRENITLSKYVTEKAGLPTLNDIISELAKPGRDPRESFEFFSFADGIEKIEDLRPGMKLPGIVTNITAFGAFVDIGVHQDGLVHISRLADKFVKDPNEVIKINDKVMVKVLEADIKRKRISLTMRSKPE